MELHTHFSAAHVLNVGLAVLIFATVWKLGSLHLIASGNPRLQHLGLAMAFQL